MKTSKKLICENCGSEWTPDVVEIVDADLLDINQGSYVVIFTCPACLKQSGNTVTEEDLDTIMEVAL